MSTLQLQVALQRSEGFALQVELEVPVGVTALIGPSGAGKSTTLSIIAGLLRPDRGRVTLGDEVWLDTERGRSLPPEVRRVGYVFQSLALFPHLTVRDNVAFGVQAAGRRARRAEAERWLARLELESLADRSPLGLSGGEAQRVALARVFAARPKVLLLDEPLAALDGPRRRTLAEEVRRFVDEERIPALHVTHALDEAQALADRAARLVGGRIVAAGAMAEVLAGP